MGCHAAGTRLPEPLQTSFPTRCSHSCSAEGSWEVGGRREPRQGQQHGLPAGAASVYLGDSAKNGETEASEKGRVCPGLHSLHAELKPCLACTSGYVSPSISGSKDSHGSPAPSEQTHTPPRGPARPCSAPATFHRGSPPPRSSLAYSPLAISTSTLFFQENQAIPTSGTLYMQYLLLLSISQ